ncbi:hypothetical protein BSNK01_11950 [Bacillaceae bacterium]
MFDTKKLNLQFFAGQVEPGEDDDLTEDEDMGTQEEDTDEDAESEEDVDFSAIFGDDEDEDDEEEDNEEEQEEQEENDENAEESGTEQEEEPQDLPRTTETVPQFTPEQQAYINRIVQERLSRDRKTQAVRRLEQETGMDIDEIVEYVRKNKIQAYAEEHGLTEEEARDIIEKEERLRELEERTRYYEQQQQEQQRMWAYQQQKQRFLHDPLVRKYEKEIDAFSQYGRLVDFEPAMNFILGEKLRSGELLQEIRRGAEQKTLASVQKRSKVTPQSASVSGKSAIPELTAQEKRLAKALGISPKEYAMQKKALKKR